ncbi:hypothetical protein ACPC5Q_03660 [Acinetobacter junii]|uniref:hypothetical protein n=1 Tax=Acinetobacter junii TaxID=40215 RepID=UPI003C1FDC10
MRNDTDRLDHIISYGLTILTNHVTPTELEYHVFNSDDEWICSHSDSRQAIDMAIDELGDLLVEDVAESRH